MFTGIITATGSVASLTPNAVGVRLLIDPGNWSYRPTPGDSVAVSGVCLTHWPQSGDPAEYLCFDVVKETLSKTTLGQLIPNAQVNLESSLRPDTPVAGHFVQGHVEDAGTVIKVTSEGLTVAVDAVLMPCIVPKGSITLDGVSLTIASVDTTANTFTVALIPTTLNNTTLGRVKLNDPINIETDILARTVVHYLRLQGDPVSTLTVDKLREAGF